VKENFSPVFLGFPRYGTGLVHLKRDDLADGATLEEDNSAANTPTVTTTFFSSPDVFGDLWIGDVCAWDHMGSFHSKTKIGGILSLDVP
jgi:hypothetical protein